MYFVKKESFKFPKIVLNLQNFYENLLRIDGPNSLDNFGVNNLVISLLKKYVPSERFTI